MGSDLDVEFYDQHQAVWTSLKKPAPRLVLHLNKCKQLRFISALCNVKLHFLYIDKLQGYCHDDCCSCAKLLATSNQMVNFYACESEKLQIKLYYMNFCYGWLHFVRFVHYGLIDISI